MTKQNRPVYLVLLAVTLVIAGLLSFYASASPDGLEHVAETTGFQDTAREHHTSEGPLADYGVKGINNSRVSGGVAGVTGALVTLLIAWALTKLLRRRQSTPTSPEA